MGVVVSSESSLAPISVASVIIGFISFAFTLGTFLKVVWSNLETVCEPAHGVHIMLNSLREELLEERASLRVLKRVNKHRRRSRRHMPESLQGRMDIEMDDVTLKTMLDALKRLMRQFEQIEKPYLKNGEQGIQQARQRGSRRKEDLPSSPYYEHPPRESRYDHESEDDMFWSQRVQYGRHTLGRRLNWLHHKSTLRMMFETLARIQTRRIARQVNGLTLLVREYGNTIEHSEDQLARLEDRLNRMGARRTD